jgi:hypothetical protein
VLTVELSVLARQCLDRRIPDQETLKQEIAAWEEQRNQEGKIVVKKFGVDSPHGGKGWTDLSRFFVALVL